MDLPPREIKLDFDLPETSSRLKKPETSLVAIREVLSEFAKNNRLFLKHVSKELLTINYFPLPIKARVEILAVYVEYLQPVSHSVLTTCAGGLSIPQDNVKADTMESLLKVVGQMILGYQRVFTEIYHLSNRRYAKVRELFQLMAYRIFELINLQLHANAVMLRPLPKKSWQTLNKIYYIMVAYEDTKKPFSSAITIRSGIPKVKANESRSLDSLYTAVQLSGYIDPLHFNLQELGIFNAYITEITKRTQLITTTKGCDEEALKEGQFFISSLATSAPGDCTQQNVFTSVAADNRDTTGSHADSNIACIFDINAFTEVFREDLASAENVQQGASVGQLQSKLLKQMGESKRVALLSSIARALQCHGIYRYRGPQSHPLDLMLYSGFAACFSCQRDNDVQRLPMRALEDQLATRSAVIDMGSLGYIESRWYGMYDDDCYLVIRSIETEYTIPLQIGFLVLYDLSGAGQFVPRLGYVVRLQRFEDRQIVINIRKLSAYNEAVTFRERDASTTQRQNGLLVIYNQAWHLLVNKTSAVFKGQDIMLRRLSGVIECQLGVVGLATHEFTLYELVGDQVKDLIPINTKQIAPLETTTSNLH